MGVVVISIRKVSGLMVKDVEGGVHVVDVGSDCECYDGSGEWC